MCGHSYTHSRTGTYMLKRLSLSSKDNEGVRTLLLELSQTVETLDESDFLDRAALLCHRLPLKIRETFCDFKLTENAVGLLVTNNPVDPDDIGPTPSTYRKPCEKRPLNLGQLMHGLYASLLGEAFGFESQQSGRIFNDLIPIRGTQPNSSSGSGNIGFHTEDCLRPFMPDYLGFLCLRNEESAVTTFSSLWSSDIPDHIREVLRREQLGIIGNECAPCRLPPLSSNDAILFGSEQRPYLRFGSIPLDGHTAEFRSALTFISKSLDSNRQELVLRRGDCLYLDNYSAVHGRAPYDPSYGPNGRWFCRLVIARDLRRTRSFRALPHSRVMLRARY